MKQSEIISAALEIYHLTDLNIYIMGDSGEITYKNSNLSIPSFMPGSGDEDIFFLHNQILHEKSERLFSYTNSWGLSYLGYSFIEGYEKQSTIIIGPYLEVIPNLFMLSTEYRLSHSEREELKNFSDQIKVLSVTKTNSLSSILQLFDRMIQKKATPRKVLTNIKTVEFKKKNDSMYEDSTLIKMRYQIEAELLYAVENGNKSRVLELMRSNQMLFTFSERFPNQPLRSVKNLGIVFNTLLRTAAGRSNVPSILLHRLSEKYAYKLEYSNQLSELQRLYNEMIDEYCNLVIENSLSNYSNVTQKVIEHLIINYDHPIEIKELASLCFIHPSHLSRKFKQETGMTITSYQQDIRINKAKYLLKHENMSIEEIAWAIGYEDSSYFSRVFKKESGFTPTQFKNSLS